jgi:plasmid stabilization system protein ParE
MKVRYSRRATSDLSSIHQYLSERNSVGASHVMTGIYASIEFVRRNPYGSEKTSIDGVHVKVVRNYRFKIFYRILPHDDFVEIVHVRHTSRRPWSGDEE